MEASAIYSQTEAFDERSTFLYLVLGLISVSRHLASRLEAEAARAGGPDSAQDKSEPASDPGSVRHILL